MGARMRNRFPPFFRVFWPEMTFPVELKKTREKTTTTKKKNQKTKNSLKKYEKKVQENVLYRHVLEKQVADISNVVVWKNTGKCIVF